MNGLVVSTDTHWRAFGLGFYVSFEFGFSLVMSLGFWSLFVDYFGDEETKG